jgi:hypothetical protein
MIVVRLRTNPPTIEIISFTVVELPGGFVASLIVMAVVATETPEIAVMVDVVDVDEALVTIDVEAEIDTAEVAEIGVLAVAGWVTCGLVSPKSSSCSSGILKISMEMECASKQKNINEGRYIVEMN